MGLAILGEGTDVKLLLRNSECLTILGESGHVLSTSSSGIFCVATRCGELVQLDSTLRRTCRKDGDNGKMGDDNLPLCPGDEDDGKPGGVSCPIGEAKPVPLLG